MAQEWPRFDFAGSGRDTGPRQMKIIDDYKAKLRFWVANPRVAPAPPPPRLPKFASQRFRNHLEMNRWKQDLLRRLAEEPESHG